MIRALRPLSMFVALLAAGIALGAPFTASFDALRADLQTRHDMDYAGTLTRTQRKELAAVDACLANLDAPHADLVDDAKSLKFAATKLSRAFKGQFTGATPGTLPGLLASAATALLAEAETAYGTLESAIAAAVDPAHGAQATDLATRARAALDEAALPDTAPATAAVLVRRAARLIVRGIDIADFRPAPGFRCRIGSRSFVAETVEVTLQDRGGGTYYVHLVAQAEHPVTHATETIVLNLTGPLGDTIDIGGFQLPFVNYATYNPDGVPDSTYYSQYSDASYGRITSFDAATGSAGGTFAVFLQRAGNHRLTIEKGVFHVTGATVLTSAQ